MTATHAAAIAKWCGGEVLFASGDQIVIAVPSPLGRDRAHVGDWVLRQVDGRFAITDGPFFLTVYEEIPE